jgi:hypothetical protein
MRRIDSPRSRTRSAHDELHLRRAWESRAAVESPHGITPSVRCRGQHASADDAARACGHLCYDHSTGRTLATSSDGSVGSTTANARVGGSFGKGASTKVERRLSEAQLCCTTRSSRIAKTHVVAPVPPRTFVVELRYQRGRTWVSRIPSGQMLSYGFASQGRVTSIALPGQAVLAAANFCLVRTRKGWTWGNGRSIAAR